MLLKIIISVFVWNALGCVKTKTVYCGYEYQFRGVWPARLVYNVSTLDVSVKAAHAAHAPHTHWGRDIIAAISQTTFSNAFS